MIDKNIPTYIQVIKDPSGRWMSALIRFSKDRSGREHKEIGVLDPYEESMIFEAARRLEAGFDPLDFKNIPLERPWPVIGMLYPLPTQMYDLNPRWNK